MKAQNLDELLLAVLTTNFVEGSERAWKIS